MKKTPIYRRDFDTSIQERMDEMNLEETRILEDYAKQIDDLSKLSLGWSEDYTNIISLENELANIKATFIDIKGYKTLLGGTPITFVKSGRVYKPTLNGVDITGLLKHKLVAHLTKAHEPKIVSINGTPAVKYLVQYSTYALEIYIFKNGNSFFKAFLSAQKNRAKNIIKRPKTYNHDIENKVDGSMFPEIEMDMLEKALELVEELENMSRNSDVVAEMLRQRTETQTADVNALEIHIEELQSELESYR